MGYRIDYQSFRNFQVRETLRGRFYALTGIFLLLFGIMTYRFWPEGRLVLQSILIPGDPAVTLPAIDTLLQTLSQGENVVLALETFSLSILEGTGFAAF